jgi:parvulin-like peptidyl-prolyl isomerase
MQHKLSICALFLFAFAAGAQVASHSPTVFKQAPAPAAAPSAAKPVARVNGAVLTDADLVREEYAIFPYARQHNGIPKDLAPEIRAGALKMIIFEELVYQEALRRKMTVPAVKLQGAEAAFRKTFPNPDEFNAFMQSEFHGSQELLDQKIRRSLLIDALLKTEVEDKSIVTPAEVRAFYDKHPGNFQHPETFTFQSISILPPNNANAAQLKEGRTRAEDALRQAKTTKTSEEFGLLAEKISDDDYRVMMGQHKPEPVDQLPPPVAKTLAAMKVGDVSDLIQVEQAYTVLRLDQHAPAGIAKFEDVKVQLQKQMELSRKNEVRAALDKQLRRDAKIEE